jgi:hypothetical protein
VPSGQKVGCFFEGGVFSFFPVLTFDVSSETEEGSAGEQPSRDSLMFGSKFSQIAAQMSSYLLLYLCLQKLINELLLSCY